MANRLKTVEYWFSNQATIADVTATALTQITVFIPEAIITFRSVVIEVIVADKFTTAGNITQRRIDLTLQGAATSTLNNTAALTNSGENLIHQFSGDFTSYFNSNWTGTSNTLDCSLTINTSATGSANASVRVIVTYEYDNASSVHVKTVRIPLNSNVGAQLAAKGAAIDTIPALDTYCPEASKTFRQMTVVIQGNQESVATVDMSVSFQIDTLPVNTSNTYEKSLNTSSWYRYNNVVTFDTSTTHSFYLWASATDFDHAQVYLVVTYEFNPSITTRVLNALMLPMEFGGGMGGPTASDYQRAERELWIEEPGVIALERCALLVFWDQPAPMTGLNMRMGTGSFVAYTSVASTVGGGCGAMIRNDTVFTLSRGRNTIGADIYNTDNLDIGYNLSSAWLINYTSDKASVGIDSHNHTVSWNLKAVDTQAAAVQSIVPAKALAIPETNHFKNAVGINYVYTTNTAGNAAGVHIGVERLASGEGGLVWENVYEALGGTDPEVGVRQAWASARSVFRRFVSDTVIDADTSRLAIETARRWRVILGGSAASFDHLDVYMTYHSIPKTVSGTISRFSGTVNLSLHRTVTGDKLMDISRVGDGAFSFTWYDDTESLYVVASDGVHYGRSADGLAGDSFDFAAGGAQAVVRAYA